MTKLRGKLIHIIETIFRWVSVPIEPGLIEVGNPNENSPVFVTCNYDLTVRRVLKHLKGLNCYLLIAPSKGINVWCASCGGDFNEHSIITAIKLTEIDKKVKHRTLILPQLSAPGIDVNKIREETGWEVKFGPVYAKHIKKYIEKGFEKTREMRLVKFGVKDRLEMATTYFTTITLITLPILALLSYLFPQIASPNGAIWMAKMIGLSAAMIYGMYLSLPSIPIKSGVAKSIIAEITTIALLIYTGYIKGNILEYLDLIAFSIFIWALVALDFNGTTPTEKSGLSEWFYKRGSREMKFFTGSYKLQAYGEITMDKENCINCGICIEVCPKGVYEIDGGEVTLANPDECINCHACEKQCPTKCLAIK